MTATLESRLTLHRQARFRRFDDEAVIVQQSSAEVIVVNDTAARLLELSDGQRTLAECATALEAEFDVEAAAVAHDVVACAEELIAAGVATIA